MRTTLTLDDDVAAKLKGLARRTGRAFRDVVNDTLRQGLNRATTTSREPFQVRAHDFGALRQGLNLHDIGALLEEVEGPLHR